MPHVAEWEMRKRENVSEAIIWSPQLAIYSTVQIYQTHTAVAGQISKVILWYLRILYKWFYVFNSSIFVQHVIDSKLIPLQKYFLTIRHIPKLGEVSWRFFTLFSVVQIHFGIEGYILINPLSYVINEFAKK
jgi:hypothetical protein